MSEEEVLSLSNNVYLVDVLRKGKLICMVLQGADVNANVNANITKGKIQTQDPRYFHLFLHMGMTGRIATPAHVPRLESLSSKEEYNQYPPKYTHITFKRVQQKHDVPVTGFHNDKTTDKEYEACFSDPRKFGWVALKSSLASGFDELAPDALHVLTNSNTTTTMVVTEDVVVHDMQHATSLQLVGQRLPIKALLLDQKRVMSGIGNWIADEVLYQSMLHPEQRHLSEAQVAVLLCNLKRILVTAVDCLVRGEKDSFPSDWIFHVRWNKRTCTSGTTGVVTDAKGRAVAFVTAGGRTSAIVPSIQKLTKSSVSNEKGRPTVKEESCTSLLPKSKSRNAPSVEQQTMDTKVVLRKMAPIQTNGKKRKTSVIESAIPPVRRSKRANTKELHYYSPDDSRH